MRALSILLSLASLLAIAGCGGPPPEPPEGYTIAMRFMSIDVGVVERVTISFRPQDGARFADGPDQMLEDGAVTLHVEDDGTLTMSVDGDYVREHAVEASPGGEKILDLHVWSDDPMMRSGPLMFANAYRSGDVIGSAMAYLPEWPPPVDVDGGCACRTQLVITCSMVDRCR